VELADIFGGGGRERERRRNHICNQSDVKEKEEKDASHKYTPFAIVLVAMRFVCVVRVCAFRYIRVCYE
jgi:hypothetical protein